VLLRKVQEVLAALHRDRQAGGAPLLQ
jgi:hypothetical protein